ncbi:hypothetical protein YC2023_021508 [Brassica napus]
MSFLKLKSDDGKPLYNHTLTMTLVEYASAVYMSDLSELFNWTCKRCNGFTKGFEVIEIIFDVEHCLQAYVGVAKDLNAIVIAFRGTQEHSIQNWVSDLFWKQLDLNYPDMSDAMVNGGEENVQVMTFGQPRVGNAAFASYYSLLVPNTFRITHAHDIVWLRDVSSLNHSVEKVCDNTGEDPTCSRSVKGNSIADHLRYFGVELHCETWRQCSIVMSHEMDRFSKKDSKGNLIMSRAVTSTNEEHGTKEMVLLLAGTYCLSSFLFMCESFSLLVEVLKLKSNDDGRPVYNHTLALTLVEYTSAVYMSDLAQLFTWTCERCNGLTKGFQVIEIIVDIEYCLQAYVGVAKDLNAIIIAFRGTQEHSIQNWISDLFWKQLDLNYPDMPDAMVHHGFYTAYHNTTVRPAVLGAVKRAKKFYGENISTIMVTGHSMGGAMAAFCGLDLVVNEGEENVQVMTFGQPRIGNADFASYYSLLVPNTFRITHDHDIVPHLPPYFYYFPRKTYHHFPTEVWVRELSVLKLVRFGVEKVCDNTGEDPTCCRSVMGRSISDHLTYFGVNLMCESWRQCNIVMSNEVERYSRKDSKGVSTTGGDAKSELLVATKSSLVAIVTTRPLLLKFAPTVVSTWVNTFAISASSMMIILKKNSSIVMTAESVVGGRENFFHCKKCGSCYGIGLRNNHRCVEDSMRHHCPICYEYLFDSLKETTVMKCGHTMHSECYHEMLKRDKSVIDMSKTWQRMDEEVEAISMPSDYRDKKVWILCNDCNDTTQVYFHIIGQKCGHCRSYNTRAVAPPVFPQ